MCVCVLVFLKLLFFGFDARIRSHLRTELTCNIERFSELPKSVYRTIFGDLQLQYLPATFDFLISYNAKTKRQISITRTKHECYIYLHFQIYGQNNCHDCSAMLRYSCHLRNIIYIIIHKIGSLY